MVADEANAEKCAKGTFYTFMVDMRAPENPVPISTLPTPRERDYCAIGTFGPHNLHENRPGSFQSEDTIFATYNNAGRARVRHQGRSSPQRKSPIGCRRRRRNSSIHAPMSALAAKTCDIYVTPEGLMYVSDWNAGLHVLQYEG